MPISATASFKLPDTLPRDRAIELDMVEGVLVFRASQTVREQIENLLEKQISPGLTETEKNELDQYEELDDYLSLQNRLARNYFLTEQGEIGG